MPRLTIVWHGAVNAEYRRPMQLLHEGEWEVSLIAPRSWSLVMPTETHYQPCSGETFDTHLLEPRMTWHAVTHTYRGLWPVLRGTQPDVFFAYEEPYSLLTYRLMRWCRKRGIPFAVQTCQDIHKTYPIPFRWTERAVLRHAAVMLGLNQNCLNVLRNKGFEKAAYVVPSGVDPQRYRDAEPSPLISSAGDEDGGGVRRIGYVGRLAHEKGLDVLFRALAGLPPEYRLTIAGDGPHGTALRALARGMGIADRVEWLGPVPHEDMPGVYAVLDVLVLASRTQLNWQEQFGRVLIEAMAAGVPVVATRCGAIPEVVGDAGLLIEEEDAATLADMIVTAVENPTARDELIRKGVGRIEALYTPERVAAASHRAFHEALTGVADAESGA